MKVIWSQLLALDWQNILLALGIFATAFLISIITLWFIRKFAANWGLVDIPSERRIHTKVTPKGGGIAIFISVTIVYVLLWLLIFQYGFGKRGSSHASLQYDMWIILAGGAVIFATGLMDDFWNLRPRTKLILESLVAGWLIYQDIRITIFIDHLLFSALVTWAWVIIITNAFNLLDNMDGLSAGVALISGMIFLMVVAQTEQWNIAWMLIGFLGAVLGFLCYNFPPASIFMGDSGSLFLGYMMASLTIHSTFYQTAVPNVFPIALPILVLAVPLFDTGTVIWIRMRQGISIFQGDKRHFSHRLVNLGMTQPHAVLLIYLITFATGLSALLLYQLDIAGALLILVQLITILLVIHILEQVGNQHH